MYKLLKNQKANIWGYLTTHAENVSDLKGTSNCSVMLWLYVSKTKLEVNAQKKMGLHKFNILIFKSVNMTMHGNHHQTQVSGSLWINCDCTED
jgi:hypothetical protein